VLLALVALGAGLGGCSGCEDEQAGPAPGVGGGGGGGGGSDPCAGVVCDEPPPPVCVAESTLRTYSGQGQCVDGGCVFDGYEDAPCTDCCYGAEINLTGDPLGGGVGYSRILSPTEATVTVASAGELLSALENASAGDVIYVDDEAEIDLTDQEAIAIPGGVTLASGRGRDGSLGALLTCDSFAYPLFRVQGESARVTGLRMRGPNPDMLDHDYDLVPHSGALSSSHPSLEVDNCELWAWGTNAVSLGSGALDAYVHHNYIHHTRRAGLGYGVVLNQAEALIEGNWFDACRHHIAATGRVGTSYEAAYNLVLEHANGHGFDMHGARDFDKRETKAIWRFDEGQGDQAEDTSIGLYHHLNHCTLTNMDTAAAWVPGQISTGLEFDGTDDHLECGTDASLLSDTGTIYLWIHAASTGQDRDLVRLFESASDYLVIQRTASGQIYVGIEQGGVLQVARTTDATVAAGGWHHVAVTQDGAGVAIYLDGQPATATGTDGTAWSGHLSLSGAWIGGGAGGYFDGVLDEVRVYSRALSAEEVALHQGGNPDIAGAEIRIHHNTFRDVEQAAIVVRGRPAEGAWIHHNWFHDSDPDHAVRQVNAQGNFEVTDNHYGTVVPLGTVLPEPQAAVEPAFGRAPLAVSADTAGSFDPVGSIVGGLWHWGDGELDRQRSSSHEYAASGRYLARATIIEELGVCQSTFVPVTVSPPAGTSLLDLWVKDSYVGDLTDRYRKQALVDGQVVWEDDVAGDEGWEHVSVDVSSIVAGSERVDVTLRVESVGAVSSSEVIEVDVFWDDVTLFGGTVGGGDFELSGAWVYTEDDASWSGRRTSREPHSGNWSYLLNHPYASDCPAAVGAEITQSVPLLSPDLLGDWRLDEGQGSSAEDRSLYGNHGVLQSMSSESWVDGVMSRALRFDGLDDHVDLGSASSLATAQGTLMFWIAPDAASAEQPLFELFDEGANDALTVSRTSEGRVRVTVVQAGTSVVDVQSTAAIDEGAFHHVAVGQDGSGVRIYLDGSDAGVTGEDGGAWADHISPVGAWLGAGHGGHFAGILDEVTLHATAPEAGAIAQAYARGFPLAHWSFDDGQGLTAADETGNGHDGTLTDMDGGSCWVAGAQGTALSFDGVDDRVECADAASLATTEGTIELWLRPAAADVDLDVLNLFEDGFENYLLVRRTASNRIHLRIEDDDQELVGLSSQVSVADSTFHHVAITQSGSGVLIYVDGAEAGASGTNSNAWTDHLTLTGLWLGAGHWSFFEGTLDEVWIHPRALRPDEVAARAGDR
jgi:hypothetical protein